MLVGLAGDVEHFLGGRNVSSAEVNELRFLFEAVSLGCGFAEPSPIYIELLHGG